MSTPTFDAGPMPELAWIPACPACGYGYDPYPYSDTAKTVKDRYGWTWPIRACAMCGVTYQGQRMTDAARRAFYGSGRYRRLCALATGQPWDNPEYLRGAQHGYADNWIEHWEGTGGLPWAHGHWLDYGGSTGVVSQLWRAQVSSESVTVTVADYGDGATTTPEQALAVPEGTYDAIICAQTLDHLPQPLQTLRDFLRVAAPSARLFCDVVKLSHTQYKLDHDTYYPTAASFLGLIERAGWSPLWLDAETHPSHYTVLAEKP